MSSLNLKCLSAFSADSYLLAVFELIAGAGRTAMRANELHLTCVNCALSLDDSLRIAGLFGLHMLRDHIESLNYDLALFG